MNVVEQLPLPRLEQHLESVELALHDAVRSDDPFLTEVAGYLVKAGGKRLRPALVLSAAAAVGAPISEEVVRGAVCVELVHLGSLYHDDVIDEATQRRGVASVNAKWGNLVAILVGDFLLARASEIAASLGTEVAGLLASTICSLCEGELSQLNFAFDTGRPEEAYLEAISGKTASLMATSTRIGALVSGAPRPFIDALTEFGRSFGIVFQMWDDICDFTSSEDDLGKPAGHDMVEGTYTLPLLLALAIPGTGEELQALLGVPLDPPARDQARSLVVGSDAIADAAGVARSWASRAEASLEPLRHLNGQSADLEALAVLGHRLLDGLDLSPQLI